MTAQKSQKLFEQAKEELRQAQEALEAGRYGEAERLAYRASDSVAAGYMARLDGVQATETMMARDAAAQNDNASAIASIKAFEEFVSLVSNAGTTPEETQNIEHVVGIVAGLREAHNWSHPDEITQADAEMTLQRVREMLEIVA